MPCARPRTLLRHMLGAWPPDPHEYQGVVTGTGTASALCRFGATSATPAATVVCARPSDTWVRAMVWTRKHLVPKIMELHHAQLGCSPLSRTH